MTQLIDALHYNPTAAGSLTYSSWPHYGPGAGLSSKNHEYREYLLSGGRVVGWGVNVAGA